MSSPVIMGEKCCFFLTEGGGGTLSFLLLQEKRFILLVREGILFLPNRFFRGRVVFILTRGKEGSSPFLTGKESYPLFAQKGGRRTH